MIRNYRTRALTPAMLITLARPIEPHYPHFFSRLHDRFAGTIMNERADVSRLISQRVDR
jgi:hypothetical protein